MTRQRLPRRSWALVISAVLVGGITGSATVPFVAGAIAPDAARPGGVLDVTHVPPLLTLPAEPIELVYEAHCAPAAVEDAEADCRVDAALFVRLAGDGPYREVPFGTTGARGTRFVARPRVTRARGSQALEYYAVFSSPDARATVMVPPGGPAAPSITRRLVDAATVDLGRHAFGASQRSGRRMAFARWGDEPDEVGLEEGRGIDPIGASAFDVDTAGSILLLDHARRGLLRWERGATAPKRIPLSINGAIADLAVATDGSFYVLESTSRDERAPLLRRFDDDGRELEAIEAAERSPAQVRIGQAGPLVLQRPSHQWMPAFVAGVPASPSAQRARGRMGRTLRSGDEMIVFRHADELRIAVVSGGVLTRSWRITSDTSLGEVQLAEEIGAQLVVVVRVYDDQSDEFVVLHLDRRGLASRMTVTSAEWAEGAPLGRFRLVGRSLYRLGSSPAGVFVDRFDLEVR